MSVNTNPVLGAVVLMRHGDRFYQSPLTYTASGTEVTALGENQAFATGQLVKARYLNASSPNNIPSLASVTDSGLFDQDAFTVIADAGGEGGVIVDSVLAAMQGMFPPTASSNVSLASGQVVVSPLGGYQYVPLQTVGPNNNITLEPWTSCNGKLSSFESSHEGALTRDAAFINRTTEVYNSSDFQAVASENADFLKSLVPIVDGRNVTMANFYNVFDYINVESIHNATFAATVDSATLAHVRDLANYHETAVFTDTDLGGIGNIAGRSLLPQIIANLQSFTNETAPARLTYLGLAYKPFISIANMTGLPSGPEAFDGLINYAGSMAFEIRQAMSGSGYEVRVNFKNGTDDADYRALPMFGSNNVDYPFDQFTSTLEPHLVQNLSQWCSTCSNTKDRGCDLVAAANTSDVREGSVTTTYGNHDVSPLAAGFIGAGVTLAVVAAAFGLLALLGLVTLGKKRRSGGATTARVDSNDGGSSSHSLAPNAGEKSQHV